VSRRASPSAASLAGARLRDRRAYPQAAEGHPAARHPTGATAREHVRSLQRTLRRSRLASRPFQPALCDPGPRKRHSATSAGRPELEVRSARACTVGTPSSRTHRVEEPAGDHSARGPVDRARNEAQTPSESRHCHPTGTAIDIRVPPRRPRKDPASPMSKRSLGTARLGSYHGMAQ